MRVLVAVHGFPPAQIGGTEIYAEALACALASQFGDDVHVLTREADPHRGELTLRRERRQGLTVHWLNNNYTDCRTYADTYRHPRARDVCARLLDALRPDVAHLHHLLHLTTDLPAELARRHVPTVATLHDYWPICARGQLLGPDYRRCAGSSPGRCLRCTGLAAAAGTAVWRGRRALLRLRPRAPVRGDGLARWATVMMRMPWLEARGRANLAERLQAMRQALVGIDLVLAPSQTIERHYRRFGVSPQQLVRWPLGHDKEPYAGLQRRASSTLRLGFVGALSPGKGPQLLLAAWQGLPRHASRLELAGAIADHGDHAFRQQLERLLEQPGVRYHGQLPHAQIPSLLSAIDLLVVPSLWEENAPLVVSEAFMAGVPVLAADVGGLRESVHHGRNGLLFAPGDVDDLRRNLRRCMEEPGLLAQLAAGSEPVVSLADDVARLRARLDGLTSRQSRRPASTAVAAVIVGHRSPARTARASRALCHTESALSPLVVVENEARADTLALLCTECSAEIVTPAANLGYAGACNVGLQRALAAGAGWILVLNNDVTLAQDCVATLRAYLEANPDVGIAGPAVVSSADRRTVESLGISWSDLSGRMRHIRSGAVLDAIDRRPRRVPAVQGCVMLIRAAVIERLGLMHEDYFFSFEEIDYCLRARRVGFATACVPAAVAYHEGSATIGRRSPERLYYAARNHLWLARRLGGERPAAVRLLGGLSILCLNLAHAMRGHAAPRTAGIRAAVAGSVDFALQRTGPRPRTPWDCP